MNDKVAEVLEKLAAKLGVTVDHLWAVLVAQVKNKQISWIVGFLLLAAATAVFIWLLKRYAKKHGDDVGVIDWGDYEGAAAGFIISGALIATCWIAAFFSLDTFLATFNNPEYVALKGVLKMLVSK